MKKIIAILAFMATISASASTVIYRCSPFSDDGDAFGEIIVMGFDVANGKPANLNLISDYFGQTSSRIASVAHAGPNGLFQAFSAPSGDPKWNYTHGLMVAAEAEKVEKFAQKLTAEVSTRGLDSGDSKVTYSCDRISE